MITMILLGIVFLAVVVPQALSARGQREQEFLDSIHLNAGTLAPRDAGTTKPSPRPRSAAARRKTILVLLLLSMAVTAVPAVLAPGKATLVVQLAVDNCFLAYIGLLVRWRDARSPARAPSSAPDLVLTQVAVHPVLRIG